MFIAPDFPHCSDEETSQMKQKGFNHVAQIRLQNTKTAPSGFMDSPLHY